MTNRAQKIINILKQTYPDAKCALGHSSSFELLVATVLSAQCTDKRVNMVTPAVFKKYPTPHHMAKAKQEDLEKLIQSTGFFRNKAKSLIEASKQLVEKYDGKIPGSIDELTHLRGVGRKTANVILGNAFMIPAVVVDTHVGRLSRRMGFTRQFDPVKIEFELMELVPRKDWTILSHLLIFHGRMRCTARRPDCGGCEVGRHCPKIGV